MPTADNAPQSFVPSFPPLAAFGGSPLYVTGEDALCATIFNAAAGVTVTITGRMLEFGQTRPTPFTQTIVPATDRSASVVRFPIGDGWLLNAQALVTVGTPAIGQTFARLSLVRGTTANAIDLFTLASGYVTTKMPLSYPGSSVLASLDGVGALRSITGATPAAGAEISETVPTGARWELLALRALFTSAVAVANRFPALSFDDGAAIFAVMPSTFNIPASSAFRFNWEAGIGTGQSNTSSEISLPAVLNNRLGPGFRIRTATLAIQAADQWSAVQYLVREWIEGA